MNVKHALIDLVYIAQPIWDKSHRHHHNRYVLSKEWKKISTKLGVEESEVKNIWKNLRQEFGKQKKKFETRSGDDANEETPSWPLYEKLLFLKDQFTPASSTIQDNDGVMNLDPGNDDDLSQQSDEPDEKLQVVLNPVDMVGLSNWRNPGNQMCETPQSSSPCNSGPGESLNMTKPAYGKRFASHTAIEEALTDFEREKLELCKRKRTTDDNDEDVGFFNSLIPTVKTLSPKDKFVFRMKVQKVLYELAFKETAPV